MKISEVGKEPNYWPRYSKVEHERLKHKFPGSGSVKCNWSQSMQDIFVLMALDGKKNGVYVELGADLPRIINNTYLLESEFDWSGVSFEYDADKVLYFNTIRRNKCICDDATTFDYKFLFEERNYPKQIDYLQLDLDPAEGTLAALKNLPLDDYRFTAITYETDVYTAGADVQDEEIEYLKSYGYELVVRNVANEGNPYEDWWVDPNVVDRAIIDKLKMDGRRAKESPECVYNDEATQK
tara:strand:- start:639 stop:1355 length:717 start_codon:yes stop_codon:yes gene_type:complete